MLGLGLSITNIPTIGGGGGSGSPGFTPLAFGSTYVAAGDSITANGHTQSGTVRNFNGRAWYHWACVASGMRLQPAYAAGAGVSGNQTSDLIARYTTDVTNKNPDVVFLLIGTNDIVTGSKSAATILADIDTILATNLSEGIITIIGKILPRNSMSAPQIAVWEAVNTGIEARADNIWVFFWDAEPAIGNMDANHTVNTDYATDGLHLNTRGAYVVGTQVVAPVVQTVVSGTGTALFLTNDAVGNLAPNGFLTGTGGTIAGGMTGTVATGYAGSASLAGGATVVASKVTRGDGFGDWQQIAVSGTYTGNGRSANVSDSTSGLSIPSGNFVQIGCDFEVDDGHTNARSIDILCTLNSGAYSIDCFSPSSGVEPMFTGAYSGTILSPILQAPAEITQVQLFMRTSFQDTAGTDPVAITARFGRLQIVDLGS